MNFVICDDNANMIGILRDRVLSVMEDKGLECNIRELYDGEAVVEYCTENKVDAVLVDVDIPKMNGFKAVDELQKSNHNTLIVFVTSHEDKVYQSWEFQPFWFVRKSHLEDLDIVLPRLIQKIDSEREKKHFVIDFITENNVISLDVNNTKYIQAYKHYVIVKCEKGEDIQLRCKISDAEKQLSPLYFVRIQSGAIVNCRFIEKITSRDVILYNGEKIHISRDKIDHTKKIFQEFIRSKRL